MKGIIIVISVLFFGMSVVFSQNQQHGQVNHFCKASEVHQSNVLPLIGQPAMLQFQRQIKRKAAEIKRDREERGLRTPTDYLPVVFHVLYNPSDPVTNVSTNDIYAGFQKLQQDFQALNTSASNARTSFGFTPASADIGFCLALKDPSGAPLVEDGIHRVSITATSFDFATNSYDMMQSATGGTDSWGRDYINIWICKVTGAAGWATLPTPANANSIPINQDGIVLGHDQISWAITHEVGHWLGLNHTWDNSGAGGPGGCGDDDGFTDTPTTAGPSQDSPGSCSGSQQSCGVETQYENFMDYSPCPVMFTQEQVDYMNAMLQTATSRNPLLTSDKCSPSNCIAPQLSITKTETFCDGESGVLNVVGTGGVTPYEYSIDATSFGSNNVFNNLSNGAYEIIVRDDAGCISRISDTLKYEKIKVLATSTASCFDYDGGSINLTATKGVEPYEYSSDNGANYSSISFIQGLAEGVYNVKVKDANNCVFDTTINIDQSHMGPTVTTSPSQCSGILGTATVTFIGPDVYTFSIDNNTSIQTGNTTYTYTQLEGGSYLFQCSDIDGCVESTTFEVGSENVSLSIDNVIHEECNQNDASFLMNTSNGVGPYSFSIDGGLSFSPTGEFTDLDEGFYSTKVIDSRGCESQDTILITNTGGVTAYLKADTTVCNGDELYLYSGGTGEGLTFTWSNGLSSDSIHTLFPNSSVTYNLTVEDIYSCSVDLTTNITVNDYPNLNLSLSQIELCFGDSIEVFATGATDYLWSNGEQTQTTFVNTPFGANNLTLYGYNGACESIASIPVTIHKINASISDSQSICVGSIANIFVNSTTNVLFNWNNGLSSTANQNVSPTATTNYVVELIDSYGCKDTLETVVSVDQMPNLQVSPNEVEVCVGEEIEIVASGATDYLWGNGEVTSLVTMIVDGNQTLSIQGRNGLCSQVKTVPITALPSPLVNISASATSINTGDGIQFGVGNSNAGSYQWDFDDGATANYAIPYHEFLFSGAYSVILTGYTGVCETSDTLLIYVGTVGVEDNILGSIKMYPNPVSEYLTIDFNNEKNIDFYLFDSEGKKVIELLNKQERLEVSLLGLSSGVYYAYFYFGSKSIVKKLIKN